MDIVDRLNAAYALVAEWPEKRLTGFIDLLALRNLVPEAAAEITRLRKERDEARAAMARQPIETAPKDGTHVFLYVPGDSLYPTVGHYDTREYFLKEYGDANYMDEGWRWSYGYPADFHDDVLEPTHWMPLPPPEATK